VRGFRYAESEHENFFRVSNRAIFRGVHVAKRVLHRFVRSDFFGWTLPLSSDCREIDVHASTERRIYAYSLHWII
jgi:hypothetical protein